MERGKIRMQTAISRSALVQLRAVEIAEQIKREPEELETFADLGDLEEESPAYNKRRNEVLRQIAEIAVLHKKLVQTSDKLDSIGLSNKKLRRRWIGRLKRC